MVEAAVEGMRASHRARSSPDGPAWAPLSAATVRRTGHAIIGVGSGLLLNPQRWRTTPRDLTPRSAAWYYPSTGWKGHVRAFHTGHPRTRSPARPIPGWTLGARETCRRPVAEAARAVVPDSLGWPVSFIAENDGGECSFSAMWLESTPHSAQSMAR